MSAPQRGDVVSVSWADPGLADRIPAPDEAVAIRLHRHPVTYIVRTATGAATGPVVTELTARADEGAVLDYDAIRAIPVRRLALAARQFVASHGGQVVSPGGYDEADARPDVADTRLTRLGPLIEAAVMNGQAPRPVLAAEFGVSLPTVDRLIKKAKGLGLLDGVVIPTKPSLGQRNALIERTQTENELTDHYNSREQRTKRAAARKKGTKR